MREKVAYRSKIFRGIIDKYAWVGVGSCYLPIISEGRECNVQKN